MNQTELFLATQLRLSGTCRRGAVRKDRVVMRSAGGRRSLVVTPAQAAILSERFARASTVPEALAGLLADKACPPLNEYYELVLQAHDAGVLVAEGSPEAATLARRWPVRIPSRAAGKVVPWLCAGLLAAAAFPRWRAPGGLVDWLAGWLVSCVLQSAGEAAAACALSKEPCEVRNAGVRLFSLFPRFAVDSADAALGGREREAAVASLRVLPVAAGVAFVAFKWPATLAPAVAGALFVLAPWSGRPARQWLGSVVGTPRLSTRSGFLFEPLRSDVWARFVEWRRGLCRWTAGHWIVWLALVALAFGRFFPGASSWIWAYLGAPGRLHPAVDTAIYAAAAAAASGVVLLARALLRHWLALRRLARPLREDSMREPPRPEPLKGDHLSVLRQVALFSEMTDEALAELAGAMQSLDVAGGQVVFNEDDPGDAFYVVIAGGVGVQKRRPKPSRKVDTIGYLGPGSCFGEIALIEGTNRTATVSAVHDSHLLKLGKADFEGLVLRSVGMERVREVLQNMAYLSRLVFLAGWTNERLMAHARCCGRARFDPQARVLTRGESNNFFYLIFDGAFEVREGGRVIRRMIPGDYFGEISILEQGLATADVYAVEESRCLTLTRADFIKLFASDYRIGLRMETLASLRSGT